MSIVLAKKNKSNRDVGSSSKVVMRFFALLMLEYDIDGFDFLV